MTEATHQPIFDRLAGLREALREESTPNAERALYHCDRLEQALKFWHAEGIRFAAYTINHIVTAPDGGMSEPVRQRVAELRAALADAGHTF